MALSRDLFLSILSMDAYNRGYVPGIVLDQGISLGSAFLFDHSLFISDSKNNEWQDSDFYAQVYRWEGETVISYRGTDAGGRADQLARLKQAPQDFESVRPGGHTAGVGSWEKETVQ